MAARLTPHNAALDAARVIVLMSTFRGERFVVEQLRSVLDQLPLHGRIQVRDDGSDDGTVAVIESLSDARIELRRGPNIGFNRSFLTLLAEVPPNTDMVLFADQDDRWLPGKIARAWASLAPLNCIPALYGSTQMLTDSELRPLLVTRAWRHMPSFQGAMAENMITGCTAALNGAGVRLLQQAGVPHHVHFHDWWTYLVVSGFGKVIFDPEPTLLYRQHGANQIGRGVGWLGRQLHVLRLVAQKDWVGILLGQVQALDTHYGSLLGAPERRLIDRYFVLGPQGPLPRWRMIFGPERWRDHVATEPAFRLLLLLYRLGVWPPPKRRLRLTGKD